MPQIYLISLAVFTGVVISLVAILLFIESQLTVKGDRRIVINEDNDKSITTPGGKTRQIVKQLTPEARSPWGPSGSRNVPAIGIHGMDAVIALRTPGFTGKWSAACKV